MNHFCAVHAIADIKSILSQAWMLKVSNWINIFQWNITCKYDSWKLRNASPNNLLERHIKETPSNKMVKRCIHILYYINSIYVRFNLFQCLLSIMWTMYFQQINRLWLVKIYYFRPKRNFIIRLRHWPFIMRTNLS